MARLEQAGGGPRARAPGSKAALDPDATPVAKIMARQVTTAQPDMMLGSIIEAMLTRDISHLPVVDEDKKIVGILSKTDVVRDRLTRGDTEEVPTNLKVPIKRGGGYGIGGGFHVMADPGVTVGDVMSARVVTLAADATVADAARSMAQNRVHGLPVVDARRRLLGFVSSLDVTRWVAKGR